MPSEPDAVIDCQSHWLPPVFFEALLGRREAPMTERASDGFRLHLTATDVLEVTSRQLDLGATLEEMAQQGVSTVVSSGYLGVDDLPRDLGREVAVALNEARAEAERAYPGRFIGLATIPMGDPAAALEALDDAAGRLGLRGVSVLSNAAGQPIDREEMLPVYLRLEELGMPVFLHPTTSIAATALARHGLEYILGYMLDTSAAALGLVLSGIIERCPRLTVVHPHLGAVLPYLAGRIDYEYRQPWAMGRELPHPPTDYLRTFYTDTVALNPAALGMALDFYGRERVLFGSDHPFWPVAEGIDMVRGSLGPDAARAVLSGNAWRLLGLAGAEAAIAPESPRSAHRHGCELGSQSPPPRT